ncbi:MAG: choloylglycine hydrolase family protein [Desulfobacteraceae bacterium]|jgi:choloylglycine hydrolase|nr:choloylglycine hydrolase family protein [Desulfobacteraceae bacterium]
MKRQIKIVIMLFLALCFACPQVFACTGITLKAEDGAVVFGRTLEWSGPTAKRNIMIIPRGQKFIGTTPDGNNGFKWSAKYGVVALEEWATGKGAIIDGLNEKGLAVGIFFHPGFAKYQKYDPSKAKRSIESIEVIKLLLSTCGSIKDVRKTLKKVRVVPVIDKTMGIAIPLHFIATEPSGKAIVIEYLKGKLKIFNAPLGAVTNSPAYDWHMTNLRNYINLSPVPLPAKKIDGIKFRPIGMGSGYIGLPGDFTPPSRFIRAVTFSKNARSTKDGKETMYEVFHILDNFNVPLASAEKPDKGKDKVVKSRSGTLWTSASDTKNRVVYYHTQHNRRVRMVDLKKIDFKSPGKITRFPMDKVKSQDIEDVTPKNR